MTYSDEGWQVSRKLDRLRDSYSPESNHKQVPTTSTLPALTSMTKRVLSQTLLVSHQHKIIKQERLLTFSTFASSSIFLYFACNVFNLADSLK